MRHLIPAALAVILAALAAPAQADTIANFQLKDVTFEDGATASGTFSYDLTTGGFPAFSIITTDSPPPYTFVVGATYDPQDGAGINSVVGASSLNFLIANPPVSHQLTVDFASPLTLASLTNLPTIGLSGTETWKIIGVLRSIDVSRQILAGSEIVTTSVTATPIPATLPLFGTSLLGLGIIGRRRMGASPRRARPLAKLERN